ncbi:MAG TPA: ATP-binding protein [bacterium]|nr:ATP-binding protein [bacterium]
MIVSIASGKGGTGKTTVAINLLQVATGEAVYADCDVEEPNGRLFLRPEIAGEYDCTVPLPTVDYTKCTFCGRCREACRFNAIAVLPKSVMIFQELCHGCGACTLACPERAIGEQGRPIGVIAHGTAGNAGFVEGRLNVGEAMSPPVIRRVRQHVGREGLVLIDAPPGTSCPVIAAVNNTDFCLLVTESTPFGLHDLKLAVAMVRALGLPHAVAINRAGLGDRRVHDYCAAEGIEILAEVPNDRRIAEAYAHGRTAVEELPELRPLFENLLRAIGERVAARGAA